MLEITGYSHNSQIWPKSKIGEQLYLRDYVISPEMKRNFVKLSLF
jgi:hypothetical protein